jgi:hypothetical protein
VQVQNLGVAKLLSQIVTLTHTAGYNSAPAVLQGTSVLLMFSLSLAQMQMPGIMNIKHHHIVQQMRVFPLKHGADVDAQDRDHMRTQSQRAMCGSHSVLFKEWCSASQML